MAGPEKRRRKRTVERPRCLSTMGAYQGKMAPAMPTAAKLEIVVKFSEMPADVTLDKNGWKQFVLDSNGVAIHVRMRPKNWNKIEAAAKQWPQWVAAVAGAVKVDGPDQLSIPESTVQVFERKAKAEGAGEKAPTEGGAEPPKPEG